MDNHCVAQVYDKNGNKFLFKDIVFSFIAEKAGLGKQNKPDNIPYLPLQSFFGWLFIPFNLIKEVYQVSISISRSDLKPEIVDKVLKFQSNCVKVVFLDDHSEIGFLKDHIGVVGSAWKDIGLTGTTSFGKTGIKINEVERVQIIERPSQFQEIKLPKPISGPFEVTLTTPPSSDLLEHWGLGNTVGDNYKSYKADGISLHGSLDSWNKTVFSKSDNKIFVGNLGYNFDFLNIKTIKTHLTYNGGLWPESLIEVISQSGDKISGHSLENRWKQLIAPSKYGIVFIDLFNIVTLNFIDNS